MNFIIDEDYINNNDLFSVPSNSNYHVSEQFPKIRDDNCVSLLHINIRSLPKNFENLKILLASINHKFSIIALSETWLKTTPHSYYSLPGYELVVNNRHGRGGGGVALYISNDLHFITREDLNISDESLESLFVEISNPTTKNIIAGVIYKAPSVVHDKFMTSLQNICSRITCVNKHCLISGDFNINLINYSNPTSQSFIDLLTTHTFLPLIDKPTRITDSSATLIDNIFCNVLPCPNSGILLSDITDHLPIFMYMYIESSNSKVPKNCKHNPSFKRDFSKSNLNQFNADLLCHSWADILSQNDSDVMFNDFLNRFNYLYDKDIPAKSHSQKSYRKHSPITPWLTGSLLKSINKKNKLYHKYLTNPSVSLKSKYTKYKNTLTSLLRSSKKEYYAHQFEKAKNSIRNTWKEINSVLNKHKSSKTIKSIISDGKLISNPDEIADCFNGYFTNIGPNLASKILHTHTSSSYTDYLTNPNKNSIFFTPVNKYEIIEVVNNLQNKKTSGHDSINMFIIKSSITAICDPLVHIINTSFMTGVVPSQLKIAKVIPVFKKGDPNCVNNYRPISILSCFSKIFEKCVYARTIKFLDKFNILSPSQFGFRNQHSTSHALLVFIDKVSKAIDDSKHTLGIFLDLSKAFDTIDHDILLYKLSYYGIRGISLEWFRSYLLNRSQYVSIDGSVSNSRILTHGVPQGSILGPLLFLIYINDFTKSSDELSFILFADDSNILCSHSNLNYLINKVNIELKSVANWFSVNGLSLNIAKSNFMLFSNSVTDIPCDVKICNTVIEKTDCCKFLGLLIDSGLKWDNHIDQLCKTISRNIGVINKIKHFVPASVLDSLYNTMIVSYLNYGILAWGCSSNNKLNRILLLQKRALRMINSANCYSHANPFFSKHRTLKVKDIYNHQLGSLMYQSTRNSLPSSIKSIFTPNCEIHSYFTRQAVHLHIPYTRTSLAYKTIKYEGPKLWNSLNGQLQASKNLFVFKRLFKTTLINSYCE